jgi:hypothetical protein
VYKRQLIDNPDVPVYARWEFVLTHLPEARGKHVYANFEDAFQRVYASGTINEVAAATELSRIAFFYYKVMMKKEIGRTHANGFHIVNNEKWAMMLADKLASMKTAKFKRGKFLPEKAEAVRHEWMN